MHYDWDFRGAENEFQRSIALNPDYATAHQWYAYDLVPLGRLDDAIAEVERAQKADPLSVIISRDVGEMLIFAGRDGEAIAQCRKTLELDPNFALAHWTLSLAYARTGQTAAALEEGHRIGDAPALSALRTGVRADIRRALADLENGARGQYAANTQIAGLKTALGDVDGAFESLERSFRERDGGLIVLAVEPEWQPLHSDPRFADLMRRVGVMSPPRLH
jgi:tetratricopeptide (TPR) repeat protein